MNKICNSDEWFDEVLFYAVDGLYSKEMMVNVRFQYRIKLIVSFSKIKKVWKENGYCYDFIQNTIQSILS